MYYNIKIDQTTNLFNAPAAIARFMMTDENGSRHQIPEAPPKMPDALLPILSSLPSAYKLKLVWMEPVLITDTFV